MILQCVLSFGCDPRDRLEISVYHEGLVMVLVVDEPFPAVLEINPTATYNQ